MERYFRNCYQHVNLCEAEAAGRKIDLAHIQPGKPTQNARVESLNSKFRDECLRIS
jgi:hypothetical protein